MFMLVPFSNKKKPGFTLLCLAKLWAMWMHSQLMDGKWGRSEAIGTHN